MVSDAGTPAAAADLSNHPALNACLSDASADVLAACRVGNRYTRADLDAVHADPDSGSLLVRLVADLAYGYLVDRRGLGPTETAALAPRREVALQTLQLLRDGERVFDLDAVTDAGVPHAVDPRRTGRVLWSDEFRIFGVNPNSDW